MNYDLTDFQNERKQALPAWLKEETGRFACLGR